MTKSKKCKCKKCVEFRNDHSFEYLDIYGLYHDLSEYIYPRLEAFRDNTHSSPIGLGEGEWTKVLNKMIFAFKTIVKKDTIKKQDYKKIEEGLQLFAKYFRDLWI